MARREECESFTRLSHHVWKLGLKQSWWSGKGAWVRDHLHIFDHICSISGYNKCVFVESTQRPLDWRLCLNCYPIATTNSLEASWFCCQSFKGMPFSSLQILAFWESNQFQFFRPPFQLLNYPLRCPLPTRSQVIACPKSRVQIPSASKKTLC